MNLRKLLFLASCFLLKRAAEFMLLFSVGLAIAIFYWRYGSLKCNLACACDIRFDSIAGGRLRNSTKGETQ